MQKICGWPGKYSFTGQAHIDRNLVLNALDMALKGRQPPQGLLHHSDRGSQYASPD